MRVLLDASGWLRMLEAPELLSQVARNTVEDAHNSLVMSIATCWEIAIKVSIGRLHLPGPLPSLLEEDRVEVLPIRLAHVVTVMGLPLHHRDPFDRMLVAQSIEEQLVLLSTDRVFRAYGIPLIEA